MDDRAKQQAKAQLDSVLEMVDALRRAREENDDDGAERAEQTIQDDALSVEVRSDWYTVGHEREDREPAEYCILLCTGGPAVRIVGELDGGSPDTAHLEYQDWGTPWTDYPLSTEEVNALLVYANVFYFGD